MNFETNMTFTQSEQIFNIELTSPAKIILLDNPDQASYTNSDNYHNKEFALKMCENYLESGYKLVEVIYTSISKPIDLYFHPETIILNPVIGFHMINNHAFTTLTNKVKLK